MNLIKIATHPYIIIISFSIILIIGEGWGSFFLFYLLLGLPYGAIHSLIALLGIVLLLINYYKYKKKKELVLQCLTEIFAVFLLILALSVFFYNDKQHYNYRTFHLLVPLLTLILFAIIALSSIIVNIISIYKTVAKKSYHHLNM